MSEMKPCPFCGEVPEVSKHFRDPLWQMIHRCKVIGPIVIDWMESEQRIAAIWNKRADAPKGNSQ